ncbi:hypothetical protein ACFLTA_02050 [Bacteroidota bacterium]
MSQKILVIDYNEDLVSKIQKQILAVRTDKPELITRISNQVNERENLYCLLFEHKGSLADMPLSEEWIDIPLAVYAQGMGDFTTLVSRLPLLRRMNIKVYFSTTRNESYRELKILASLGVQGCLIIDPESVDWNLVSDLMHYVVYTKTRHANIDPFSYIVEKHKKDSRTDYNHVYFNDPAVFIHVGPLQEISLSHDKLRKGEFLGKGLDLMAGLDENEDYISHMNQWQEDFIQTKECSFCPGWRVCLGKFSTGGKLDECSAFFSEMLEAVDYVKSRDKKKEPIS